MQTMISRCAVIAAIIAPLTVITATSFARGRQQQNLEGKTAAQTYKNIKVLTKVPAKQIIPIMHLWSDSLGVRCDFCHVVETDAAGHHVGWEKDDKPEKAMARKMATMTMKLYTSEKILDRKASCYMCHHGHAMPEVAPPAAPAPSR